MEEQEQQKLLEENAYLKAQVNVYKKKGNQGEKDEVLFLMYLLRLIQINQFYTLVNIFGDEAIDGIQLLSMDTREIITDVSSISKASSVCKADCMFVMMRTNKTYKSSIKSKNGGKSSIMNHMNRSKPRFYPRLMRWYWSITHGVESMVYQKKWVSGGSTI